jgi:hypothetical protein
VRPALWPSLIGIAVGAILLPWFSGYALRALRIALGIAIIVSALSLLVKVKTRDQLDPPYVFALTGVVSGLMGGLFSTAGPPLVFQMYRQPLRPEVIRECLLMMFAIGQVVRLLIILATGQFTSGSIGYAVMAMPVVFLVTKGNRRFPLKLSASNRSRIAGLLLLMVGLGLVLT